MKRWVARVCLAAFAAVFALGAVEGLIRVLDSPSEDATPWGPHYDRSHAVYIPQEGRMHPWTRSVGGDVFRVAVIGDSFTLGAGVQTYDTYPRRLEYLLNLNDDVRPADVQVFADGGLCTFQELRLLPRVLESSPDLVVLGVCLNDAEDWHRPAEFKAWRDEILPREPKRALAWWVRNVRVAEWVYRKREGARSHRAHLAYYHRLYDTSYSGWVHFDEALGTFRDLCDDAGVALVVMVFPLLSWDFDDEVYPFGWIHEQIGASLQRREIPALDLWEAFRGKSSIRVEVIPKLDGHPNEIGHRIAAEALFEYLVMNRFVDAAYAPKHTESQVGYWLWMKDKMDGLSGAEETP